MTSFTLHTLRIFNTLYWSLRNNLYGTLTFFTPVDFTAYVFCRCFIGERLSYHCFYASFFNQTVEREDDADGVFPPSQYLYQRFSTLGTRFSRFSRHFSSSWRCEKCRIQHKRRSIFWSFFAVWTLFWLGKSSVLVILRILEDIDMAVRSRQQHQVSKWFNDCSSLLCCTTTFNPSQG